MTWLHVLGIAALIGFICYAQKCAYYNGVNDGFGYGQEPTNPGYRKAGAYLRKYAAYRWKVPPVSAAEGP